MSHSCFISREHVALFRFNFCANANGKHGSGAEDTTSSNIEKVLSITFFICISIANSSYYELMIYNINTISLNI